MLGFEKNKRHISIIGAFILLFVLLIVIIIFFQKNKPQSVQFDSSLENNYSEKTPSNISPGPNGQSINKNIDVSGWKKYTSSSVNGLPINFPPEYQVEFSKSNSGYFALSKTTQSNTLESISTESGILSKTEFNIGPSYQGDSLSQFATDRKALRSMEDKIILEEYTTLGGIPVFHEVIKDVYGTENSYLAIVNGQRIIIYPNNNFNLIDLNNIMSTLPLSPTSLPILKNTNTPVPSGPLPAYESNAENSTIHTQKQGTFTFDILPTKAAVAQNISECSYGPGAANCVPSNPRTCVNWQESGVLAAFEPPIGDSILHVWYQDEHALTLGAGNVSAMAQSPDHVVNPNTGDQTAVDAAGRPVRPALFITDITADPSSTSGDWEYGGVSYNPSEIFGSWKPLDTTTTQRGTSTTDPTSNGRNLGAGSVAPPASVLDKFVSEIRWDLSKLNLSPGHIYRLEFMVHDGDRQGGDAGEKCATIQM